jgi:F-type H+-transporting ATPase subunit epsilon
MKAIMPGFLKCVVVTPEKAVLDEAADFVVVPMFDGELGVAPDRLPLIGRLGFGELRISKGADTKHYYVDGGFVQIRGNVVTVLTSKAIPVKDIKIADAESVLKSPKVETTPEGQEAQQKAQQRARAQLRIAQKSA